VTIRRLTTAGILIALAAPLPAFADGAAARTLERVAVRFYAPETGGTARPRFVMQRMLAFEARLEAMSEKPDGTGEDYQERHLRAALEHHVAEEMLASLADKLIGDIPPSKRPTAADLAALQKQVGGAVFEQLGGRTRVEEAAAGEQIDAAEVDGLMHRGALAAWYLDRAVSPLLSPGDEQLREVYRTSAHPYRGHPFEQVRPLLERWFVVQRVRVAEGAFLQAARARVRIIVTR